MSEKDAHLGEVRPSVRDQFERAHSTHLDSQALQRVWRGAYGEDYS
jgi:hypothetical protein